MGFVDWDGRLVGAVKNKRVGGADNDDQAALFSLRHHATPDSSLGNPAAPRLKLEIILAVAIFAGFPAAINAMVIAKQVFADRAADKK